MKTMTSAEVRQMFLDFFKSKGHTVEPSQSLVPVNDPTLLWINSGVALKKYFDGSVVPENPRLTNAQKAIRTNDIENVGKTARHHTMFEMLGNFSIGDYFRKEAIAFAWELLTSSEWFEFPAEKLYITYYPADKDTYNRWVEVGVDPTHLVPIEDNFWEIGAGPSGPDTEIFFDRGEVYDPEHVGLKLLAEEMTVILKSGTLFFHNLMPIHQSLVQNILNCHKKILIREWDLNEWFALFKAEKQTLIQTYSYQSFVKLKNYLEKHIVQTAKI